jgi:hypothetical protein
MTKLKPGSRKLERETAVESSGRPIVISLWPRYLTLRLKGGRQQYDVAYTKLLLDAEKGLAEQESEARHRRHRKVRRWRDAG